MKWAAIVGILTLFGAPLAPAQNDPVLNDTISTPNLSSRCQELMRERNERVKMRQQLSSLLLRNQNLLKNAPKMRVAMRSQLESTRVTIRNELYLVGLQIQGQEETAIRSGCPFVPQ
jgi:hypothetical protein